MTDSNTRLALVTGASRGLGYATARRLGAAGWHVVALARTVGGLEELADAIEADGGPTPTLVPLSITDDGGMQRLCVAIYERWGYLDLAIHCAANAPPLSPAHHIGEKDFNQAVDVNVHGTRRLIAMLEPLLVARHGGRFVHVTDNRAGQSFFGAYGATKAAAEALVRSWAAETRQLPPEVLLFAPRAMPTALHARFYPGEGQGKGLPSCDTEAARLLDSLDL